MSSRHLKSRERAKLVSRAFRPFRAFGQSDKPTQGVALGYHIEGLWPRRKQLPWWGIALFGRRLNLQLPVSAVPSVDAPDLSQKNARNANITIPANPAGTYQK